MEEKAKAGKGPEDKDEAKEAFEKGQSRFAGPVREEKALKEGFEKGMPMGGRVGREKPEVGTKSEADDARVMRTRPGDAPAAESAPAPATEAASAPAAEAVPAPAAESPWLAEHTVVSGDNLSYIAKHYYGTADKYMKIYEANKDVIGSNPSLIRVGQVLKIPKLD